MVAGRLPAFLALKLEILQDLETHVTRLVTLNVSRREALARHLDRLAGQTPGPSTLSGNLDPAAGLRRWIEGPRTPAQNQALQTYFEEVALITLGQCLLLKAWSDRDVRAWSANDLKDLNWALNTALKPHIPLGRENWQIACKTIYSWYRPSPTIQMQIWTTLAAWDLSQEDPGFLYSLLGLSRQAYAEMPEPRGYDTRFFQALWHSLKEGGHDFTKPPAGPIRRTWSAFSPTLRDGAITRSAPETLQWIGLESSPFQLLLAEMSGLWEEPAAPALWAPGTGLEVHTRDQLSLALGSPKPSLLTRIAEMEACDCALVLEERAIRMQSRAADAAAVREQLETLPYFRKLKSPTTSLGDLQACVSLTKLRPGGILLWTREEPLSEGDGREVLNFLLDRARLVCEWDFSELEHALPALPGAAPLYPRYFYAFVRETGLDERLHHRPRRVVVQGQIRSHVEVDALLAETLLAGLHPESAPTAPSHPRGSWHVHAQLSPTPQRDWQERWPDSACQQSLRELDRLKSASRPLASFATIRHSPEAGPDGSWRLEGEWQGFALQAPPAGAPSEGRRLTARALSEALPESCPLILIPETPWLAPIARYLESSAVASWLDHHAERRGDRWILSEQLVRAIPVPSALLAELGVADPAAAARGALPPPSPTVAEEAALARLLTSSWTSPDACSEAVAAVPAPSPEAFRARVFTAAAREHARLLTENQRCLHLISADGQIRWGELLKLLPPQECISPTIHTQLELRGQLPLHMAIGRIDRVKSSPTTGGPGILFNTEAGFHMTIGSSVPSLLDMIWEQVKDLQSPTWAELVTFVRVPRRLELAQSTAQEILLMHGEKSRRLRDLSELLSACRWI